MCRHRVTLGHASALKKIQSILSLGQEQSVRGPRDGDAEEVMQIAEVHHSKLGVEVLSQMLK